MKSNIRANVLRRMQKARKMHRRVRTKAAQYSIDDLEGAAATIQDAMDSISEAASSIEDAIRPLKGFRGQSGHGNFQGYVEGYVINHLTNLVDDGRGDSGSSLQSVLDDINYEIDNFDSLNSEDSDTPPGEIDEDAY